MRRPRVVDRSMSSSRTEPIEVFDRGWSADALSGGLFER